MTPKLIIFDFDGTLADTTATILHVYHLAIKESGAEPRTDAQLQATIGVPLREGFHQLYPDYTEERLDECVTTYRRIFRTNKKSLIPALYPGVRDGLAQIAEMGIEMSVASSRSRDSLVEFMEENGIAGYFSLILGCDDVTRAKPDPEPVLVTLQRLHKEADETLVVGDMPVDIAMGDSAGCATVGITYGNSTPRALLNAGATYIINSFPELLSRVLAEK